MRGDDFRGDGPDDEVEQDFARVRRRVVRAQAEPALEPEHEREGGGEEQEVVEMRVEKRGVRVRLEHAAIERVERAREQARGVERVAKARHSAQAMARPVAAARAILQSRIMDALFSSRSE